MTRISTKTRIAKTADRLFYEKGFEATSFADIAAVLGISRGNFYHHFKSKDDILAAVILLRLQNTRAMLAQWQADEPLPAKRIVLFIRILIVNQSKIIAFGCPVGTLCAELAKLDHHSLQKAVSIFGLFHNWLTEQFRQLHQGNDAEALAMALLARSQGVATMTAAFRDISFAEKEVAEMAASVAKLAGKLH